ncbi:MAG TPA: DUF3325 domain-containing protein [Nitrospiraceae bacterium]|nr:DUF3325 domain-containing protein [Nitrospiraceae bacterium]
MRSVEFALSYNGLLALCLAMPKHYRQVFAQTPGATPVHLFRLGGWLSLMASLAVSIAVNGWSFGPIEWVGMLAVTSLGLVFMLPYAPRVAALSGLVLILSASIVILS